MIAPLVAIAAGLAVLNIAQAVRNWWLARELRETEAALRLERIG